MIILIKSYFKAMKVKRKYSDLSSLMSFAKCTPISWKIKQKTADSLFTTGQNNGMIII